MQQEKVYIWATEGKVLTPYSTNSFLEEKSLAISNNAYRMNTIVSQNFRVVDTLSAARTPHNVCIDRNKPGCN